MKVCHGKSRELNVLNALKWLNSQCSHKRKLCKENIFVFVSNFYLCLQIIKKGDDSVAIILLLWILVTSNQLPLHLYLYLYLNLFFVFASNDSVAIIFLLCIRVTSDQLPLSPLDNPFYILITILKGGILIWECW